MPEWLFKINKIEEAARKVEELKKKQREIIEEGEEIQEIWEAEKLRLMLKESKVDEAIPPKIRDSGLVPDIVEQQKSKVEMLKEAINFDERRLRKLDRELEEIKRKTLPELENLKNELDNERRRLESRYMSSPSKQKEILLKLARIQEAMKKLKKIEEMVK